MTQNTVKCSWEKILKLSLRKNKKKYFSQSYFHTVYIFNYKDILLLLQPLYIIFVKKKLKSYVLILIT